MWPARPTLRVWLCQHPTDMRKSFDGLSAMAKGVLGEDPLSGELFVFVNRRRTHLKCLYFEGDGYCVWAKRLERGCFQVRFGHSAKACIDWSTFQLLVEGIDLGSVRRLKRYRHAQGDRQLIAQPV